MYNFFLNYTLLWWNNGMNYYYAVIIPSENRWQNTLNTWNTLNIKRYCKTVVGTYRYKSVFGGVNLWPKIKYNTYINESGYGIDCVLYKSFD